VSDTRLADAQHEAAHVVVGTALGLRLTKATIESDRKDWAGFVQFYEGAREAFLIMYAAGPAWERRTGGDLTLAHGDLSILRSMRVRGTMRVRALELAAWAVLESRAAQHARVTRALLEGDLTHRQLLALFRR
jgi:hypothetical protein